MPRSEPRVLTDASLTFANGRRRRAASLAYVFERFSAR